MQDSTETLGKTLGVLPSKDNQMPPHMHRVLDADNASLWRAPGKYRLEDITKGR